MSNLLKKSTPDEFSNRWFESLNESTPTTYPVPLIYTMKRSEKEMFLLEEVKADINTGQEVAGYADTKSTTTFVTEWSVLEQSELQEILKTGINYDFVVDWF